MIIVFFARQQHQQLVRRPFRKHLGTDLHRKTQQSPHPLFQDNAGRCRIVTWEYGLWAFSSHSVSKKMNLLAANHPFNLAFAGKHFSSLAQDDPLLITNQESTKPPMPLKYLLEGSQITLTLDKAEKNERIPPDSTG